MFGHLYLLSFEFTGFHVGALRLATELPALVLSADYRLAPEHRLPVALDDVASVFSWLTSPPDPDPWLAESADLAHVFVAIDSTGGNIAHHLAMRHAAGSGGLGLGGPALALAGCVMLWSYFSGEERTPSEAAAAGQVMDPAWFDQMWRLALPAGATRDHPFTPGSVTLGELGAGFPPMLVVDLDQDLVHDRVVDYVARLEAARKKAMELVAFAGKKAVELVVFAGQGHGFFAVDPCSEASDELIRVIRRFVHGAC